MALNHIQTIIIVIMENRSFDHAMGYLSLGTSPHRLPVDGLQSDPAWRAKWINNYQGEPYPLHLIDPATQVIDDPPHDAATIDLQITTPPFPGSESQQMGGFVKSYMKRDTPPKDRSLVMGYYDQRAVPTFDFFAHNYVVCDRWFAALPTGTQANRLMAMSGKSSIVDNATVFLGKQDLVYDWLTAHHVPWCAYQSGDFLPFFSLMPEWLPEIVSSLTLSALGARGRFRRFAAFKSHWMATDPMPNVIFIEPEYTDGPHVTPNDDHAPTGIAGGQLFLAGLYNALIANPDRWANTMLLVTYDEHGGFFDHVSPLEIPANAGGHQFKTTGVRVPAFVISPQVQAGTAFSRPLDHTSIRQLLADRFNPGQDYSPEVGARQPKLARIASILSDTPNYVNRPVPIADGALSSLRQLATQSAGASLSSQANKTTTAQAFQNAALRVSRDHPDLLSHPTWDSLNRYVSAINATQPLKV